MFRTELLLQADRRPDNWIVRAPLVWECRHTGTITVPVGTVTDLASIPRILRNVWFLDPNGRSRRPAVLHDYLYRGGDRYGTGMTRAKADRLLRIALQSEGAGRWVAAVFWLGVRAGGWAAWVP